MTPTIFCNHEGNGMTMNLQSLEFWSFQCHFGFKISIKGINKDFFVKKKKIASSGFNPSPKKKTAEELRFTESKGGHETPIPENCWDANLNVNDNRMQQSANITNQYLIHN